MFCSIASAPERTSAMPGPKETKELQGGVTGRFISVIQGAET